MQFDYAMLTDSTSAVPTLKGRNKPSQLPLERAQPTQCSEGPVLVRRFVGASQEIFFNRGGAAATDTSSIHAPQLPINRTFGVGPHLQYFDYQNEHTRAFPLGKTSMHADVGSEPFGHITPWGAGLQKPETFIEHEPWNIWRTTGPRDLLGFNGSARLHCSSMSSCR
jgi:hypothetical protein